ncbi:MAG: M20/M25/M40 family metallo-hydrolase [Gemmatimonadaceae bacterium]
MGYVRLLFLRVASFALAVGLIPACALAQPSAPSAEQILKAAQSSFAEFFELLAIPNDAIVAPDIRRNTDWLERAFVSRGFAAKQLPNDGKPLLFAEYSTKKAGARTVLFYMHLDGQPVIPGQWAQSSPWIAVVKKRDSKGEWEPVGKERLQTVPLDPELRVFARSAADDKGPIMMFLAAFDALKAARLEPEINVKVILDSEEEKGSPTINRIAKANAALLRSDGLIIQDGPRHPSNRPTLVFGNRGNITVTLTVYGPKNPLHSGHYGNYVPNPAQRLAGLLGSMKDDEGRVTIPGYYDRVKLSDVERGILAEVQDDEAGIRRRVGIAKSEAVGRNYQESLQYPSLNIRGMQSGAIADKAANIVPSEAVAELDLRTTPETEPEYLYGLIEKHIRGRGWHISKGPPTDAERATHDKIASVALGRGSRAARTPMDVPVGAWVYRALERTFGDAPNARPVRIRMMGGSVPTDQLVDALGVPFVIVPLVNGDNNQHSFDENLRIGHYVDGIRAMIGLLRTPF